MPDVSPQPDSLTPQPKPQAAPAHAAAVTLAEVEREQILAALNQTGWRVGGPKGAAARLGIKRTTLQKTMKRLGVSRPG